MIYLDSAATGFLKPDCVAEAVYKAMKELGNSGRGTNAQAMEASRAMYGTRRLLGEMFGCRANQVSFAANATEALNTAIYGTLFPGKEPVHVLTTAMEHNSVLRPLYRLEKLGLMLTVLPADGKGRISLKEMERAIRPETKAIVCTHASNLTGNVNPIRAIGELAERHGLLFILDCAQTAGVLPVSMEKDHISILCASGHKGLMGPQGTGFLCVKEGVKVEPLKVGGSGTETFPIPTRRRCRRLWKRGRRTATESAGFGQPFPG